LTALALLTSALFGGACGSTGAAGAEYAGSSEGLSARNNLIKNSDFEDGTSLPWTISFTDPANGNAAVENGAFCLNIQHAGTNAWDAQVRHREMVLNEGREYTVQFVAFSSKPTKVRAKLGMSGPPYAEYWNSTIDLGPEPSMFRGGFIMRRGKDATAEFAFHMGGQLSGGAPLTVCLDDVFLNDPLFIAPPREAAAPVPDVRVNQVGYLPGLPKYATVRSGAKVPVSWRLFNSASENVAEGMTHVFGDDADSGEHVHWIDFSSFIGEGTGFVLEVGGNKSHPFDIGPSIYSQLRLDALLYFYLNRSGIELKMPYSREPQWARPAGHLSDKKVPCAPDAGCNYALDVSGGWYDAGDYGKYVVNGGITAWTFLNYYESAKHLTGGDGGLGDGSMNIPESGNGVPDILDEARWQIEFMLRMQVPEGKPKAGMVHHKIHDEKWTALGIAPHESTMVNRFLRPVSTAATLNVAAVGAQCARVYRGYDPAFADRCLGAAERAWKAAEKHPDILITEEDGKGGGSYFDPRVADDFYWAAAELYITTGKPEYRDHLVKNKHHKGFLTEIGGGFASFNWQDTSGAGHISLAIVPNQLGNDDVARLRRQIVEGAQSYLLAIEEQGYRVPMRGENGMYPWGSNSFILNNMLVLGVAHELSGDDKYLAGMVSAMDYLLGRNALGQSYVTGYGEKPLRFPHHRFWAYQANDKYPMAPPGAVSGGPNSSLQDPYVKAAGMKKCAPQKCFLDNIEAWSVNEITINWNAPFAWSAAYLDEKARRSKPSAGQKAKPKKP
jgi:endoglucanase